jgi:hypothetical protein
MLHHAHGRALRKDGQDVEAELGRELESGQDADGRQETAKFLQSIRLIWLQPAQKLEQLQIFDLAPEVGVATHGVVIGEGDDVQAAFLGPAKNVEDADGLILVVSGSRGVNVKVDSPPRQVGWWRC